MAGENAITPEDWPRAEALFHLCADKAKTDQQALLDAHCHGRPGLRSAVEALLSADAESDASLDRLRRSIEAGLLDCADDHPDSLIGALLGPWRIVETLGHGGMGLVYSAQRDDERFEKKVAIKVLRGFGTPADVARFRRERRILAALDHPRIARLIDGGEINTTGIETPYIVMEFVDGEPITKYCEKHGPDIRTRVALFTQVVDAVQYAHQHFVLHRDLTPGNILVTPAGEVKLLDFGIATLIQPSDEVAPIRSQETRALTPEYSSPEQARGGRLTAATDVYSLGAVLYELITGRQPLSFSSTDPIEIVRTISDQPVPAPEVDEDLDNITLKALQKDPARRYESVALFADDLRRYLEGRAVLARPDSLAYRTRKFVGRNRWPVAGAALFLAAVTIGTVTTAYQARKANARADELRKLAGQLLFQVHDSVATLPGATGAREVLVKTSADALDRLTADAGASPDFLLDLAASYERLALLQGGPSANVGALDAAAASYRKATAVYDRLPAAVSGRPDVLRKASACWVKLGSVLMTTGHLADARPALQRGLDLAERARSQSGSPSVELVDALRYSGDLEINSGAPTAAIPLYRRASDTMTELVAKDATPDFVRRLAVVSFRAGEAEIAIGGIASGSRIIESAVERIRALAAKDPQSPTFGRELGVMALRLADTAGGPEQVNIGDADKALAWANSALAQFSALANQDPANARGQLDLAQAYVTLGSIERERDPQASVKSYERAFRTFDALPAATRDSPRNSVLRLRFERGYGAALANSGRTAQAISVLRTALTRIEAKGANFTDDIGFTLAELARAEERHGDHAAAVRDLERAVTALSGVYSVTLNARKGLSEALLLQSSWMAKNAATCRGAAAPFDRALSLWRELESNAISGSAAQRARESIERRAPPPCR